MLFNQSDFVPAVCHTFIVLVLISQAVELWLVDKAVLPIENSVGGSIHRNYDLLLRHRLHIVGEVQLVVNHCLLGLPGVRKEELKRVVSHPQVIVSFIFRRISFFSSLIVGRYRNIGLAFGVKLDPSSFFLYKKTATSFSFAH